MTETFLALDSDKNMVVRKGQQRRKQKLNKEKKKGAITFGKKEK